MLRVLLVKTSSLGDVVHNLPVASDIRRQFPDAAIDWVIEEPFVPLVRMHFAVRRVIPVAVRRWRTRVFGRNTWREIAEFRRLSQSELYDAVIDTQGLVKSTLIARAARGRRHGFDEASAREPLAARFYDVKHHVAKGQHAVARNRLLAAAALGYRIETPVDYGLAARNMAPVAGTRPVCMMIHGTARAEKLWPVEAWIELGMRLAHRGVESVLPWGTDAEHERSKTIAAGIPGAAVLPHMGLERIAAMLSASAMVVGVDTGLTHLAAALGRPAVALFTGTDPSLYGLSGGGSERNLGHAGATPAPAEVMKALADLQAV